MIRSLLDYWPGLALIALVLFAVGCQQNMQQHGDEGVIRGTLSTQNETEQEEQTEKTDSEALARHDQQISNEPQEETEPEVESKHLIHENTELEGFCLDLDPSATPIERVSADCKTISARLASVSYQACRAANFRHSNCSSHLGFPIYVAEFAPLASRQHRGRVLVVGGTHGDELTSVSIVFRWIEKLNQFHSGLYHWRMVPLMNPDGVLRPDAQRTNNQGVDLNRNMPSADWHKLALDTWQRRTGKDPRKFPGDAPASEPEVQWMLDEIKLFKPHAIISVHAPYGIVDFDAPILNKAPKQLGRLRLNMLGTYPGSLGNYAGIDQNIPVITLELPHAWVMPSHQESTKIWEDIVSWLKKHVDQRDSSAAQAKHN